MDGNPHRAGQIAEDVVDLSVLAELHDDVGCDRTITADLVRSYAGRAPDLVAALQRATSGNDTDEIRRIAHDLRSMSAFVGAMAVASLSAELEDGDWPPERAVVVAARVAGLVPAAVDELERFVAEL